MKKFFTNISQAREGMMKSFVYEPVGNDRLRLNREVSYPILAAIHGYAKAGEEIRVIAVQTPEGDGPGNLERLRAELAELCGQDGIICREVETIPPAEGEQVLHHVSTFRRLIDKTEDADELFACVTYGTKPASMALLTAVRYAYRIHKNITVPCVVYGHIQRIGDEQKAYVCDETALVQLDELVRLLAGSGIRNPQAALEAMLSL